MISLGVFFATFLSLVGVFGFVFVPRVQAVCPVCTAAVIGGLGVSRIIGIDDTVSGVWIGGLILSSSFWLVDWIDGKGYFKKVKRNVLIALSALSLYLVTFVPMIATNFIGHPANKIFGVDKLIFGTAVGSVVFLLGIYADKKVRKVEGRQLFNFQKVVFPVSGLLIISIILYFVTRV